ncbi:MAG: NAD(P)/FAD-dependent oxidoreductase [Myxococcota bacterium]|jgi:glycerol-3-phosphate dehydrogenase|nr:NAD(P)/FAD-dependent oxidoreductase [Myxococcota bacterium]
MNTVYDVAIIGGGVIGCAIARELSRYRLKCLLIERNAEPAFGTTKTNSGIIHSGQDSSPHTLKGRLVVEANPMFDSLQAELGFGFRRIGALVVARSSAELEELERQKRQGQEKGVPGLELWDADKLHREEPNLSPELLAALYAPSAGVINPYEFAFALLESAIRNGVELWVEATVERIDVDQDVLSLSTTKGQAHARYVLNCAGVYADTIAAMVGERSFSIRPRKGEEYMLDKRLRGLVRRLVFPLPTAVTKGILIIPTFDGTIMVGPTAHDTNDREDVSTTEAGADEVFSAVGEICPSITKRDTITEFAGLRAASDSGDFIIGPSAVRGFINVAGIQSPGLTAAPAIARYVRELLEAEGLQLEARDEFQALLEGPPRFAQKSVAEQREAIAKDPRFARVICRCELVTEAEIHHAIDHGARTLDGIKFRSRAGMGRCQGGFCTLRCMDILSERLQIPFSQVSKRGAASWLVQPMLDAQSEANEASKE